jgi:hypothetical protein
MAKKQARMEAHGSYTISSRSSVGWCTDSYKTPVSRYAITIIVLREALEALRGGASIHHMCNNIMCRLVQCAAALSGMFVDVCASVKQPLHDLFVTSF